MPHILGISVGCGLQAAIVATLLAWAMAGLDVVRDALVLVGCAHLLWLAWRRAHASAPGGGGTGASARFSRRRAVPVGQSESLMMAINAALIFLPRDAGWSGTLTLAILFIVVNLPCIALWAVLGDRLRSRLRQARTLRVFNGVMALLLAATALWIVADELLAR